MEQQAVEVLLRRAWGAWQEQAVVRLTKRAAVLRLASAFAALSTGRAHSALRCWAVGASKSGAKCAKSRLQESCVTLMARLELSGLFRAWAAHAGHRGARVRQQQLLVTWSVKFEALHLGRLLEAVMSALCSEVVARKLDEQVASRSSSEVAREEMLARASARDTRVQQARASMVQRLRHADEERLVALAFQRLHQEAVESKLLRDVQRARARLAEQAVQQRSSAFRLLSASALELE
ncbi:unnamed protein product, partial [Polarella glacialis]